MHNSGEVDLFLLFVEIVLSHIGEREIKDIDEIAALRFRLHQKATPDKQGDWSRDYENQTKKGAEAPLKYLNCNMVRL